ncbi:Homeodomain-like domain-containing protein [Rhizobium mongolense subsp. loessense]|uniref:Homeodomain-like domain-containing protein n=1 Tax=Rhizobium mongolense subsp. loessense TaxID=158890 RepID=A0A1G4SFS0_9HYPH|nr:Homeodomain-like domain-containing protein [Rhizobium mongolense subsp. loessense]
MLPSGLSLTERSDLGFLLASVHARLWHAGISITLTPSDRQRLEAVASNRNTAQKHVWRAVVVPLSADGVCTTEIMRRTGTSKTCVWRWQERFMQEGVNGLLREQGLPLPDQGASP